MIGAAIGFLSNGIQNVASGNNFFQGGLKAAAMGAWGGGVSAGIGQAFGNVSGFGNELHRAGAHGVSGGFQSMAGGGSFGSGFLSGGISSGFGSGIGALGGGATAQWAGGGLSGGLGSVIGGGNFFQGAGMGLMVGGLNHAGNHLFNGDPPWLRKLKQAYKEFWESLGLSGSEIPSYSDTQDFLADTEAKYQRIQDGQMMAMSMLMPGPFDDAIAAKYVTGKIIQTGGSKISSKTLKTLRLFRNQMKKAIHNLKDAEGLPANFHGRITKYGDYLHPTRNWNYGNLYNHLD